MKIVLASYWEPENHGPGRKIGISPSKPRNLQEERGYDCDLTYPDLSPGQLYWDYFSAKKAASNDEELKEAGKVFVSGFVTYLEELKQEILAAVESHNTTVFKLMGLQDGDTLLSWEKEGHLTYRMHVANFLRELGYEVDEK